MTTLMFADRLEVQHHDNRVTVYEWVHYWPYAAGVCVDILAADGRVLVTHDDVLNTLVGAS